LPRRRIGREGSTLQGSDGKPAGLAAGEDGHADASPVHCAVVLAAGLGSRLRATVPDHGDLAKPLTPLHGVSLLVRSLATLATLGVRDVVLVVGYAEEQIRTVAKEPRLSGLRITFARNPEWRRQNGLSVLAAREPVGNRPFFLLMGDHLFDVSLLRRLVEAPRRGALTLAVDRRAQDIYDLDDAVKVQVSDDGRIVTLGKTLPHFNAVDTGAFIASPALFAALEQKRAEQGGDCSLSDGVAALARAGAAFAVDIGDAWWQDVDDYTALRIALDKLEADDPTRGASSAVG
jgi:choline kinase